MAPGMIDPLVQIADKSGSVMGLSGMLEALNQGLIRRTVHVMLIDADGRYLLQQRSETAPNYSGFWDASAGGHVDEGETPEVAAYRELKEELGLAGVALHQVANFYFESEGDGRTYRYFAHVYTGRLSSDTILDLNLDEVKAARFYSTDQISDLANVTPITRHIIDLL